jgi:arginine exporter protein ArgO
MVLCLSLIAVIHRSKTRVIHMGLMRQRNGADAGGGVCVLTDIALIGLGVVGLAPL